MHKQEFDVVYTWVDDSFPGYLEELNKYADDKRDLNPNRTRDNLDVIRYSMRSVARHLPDVRRIYLFTCRPQIPAWLDEGHPKIHVVHHDQVIAPQHLPTFSSFGIVSHLHLLPGLSDRFLYFEDDILANSNALLETLWASDGRPNVCLGRHQIAPLGELDQANSSPWNLALGHADQDLTKEFGAKRRFQSIHGPQLFDKELWGQIIEQYPALFEATRAEKFRSAKAVPPEIFIPLHCIENGKAHLAPNHVAQKVEGYVSVENFALWTWAQLKRVDMRHPLSIALNDSFGDNPNPRVVKMVKRWLNAKFPNPAPWEKTG